jgi:hypothetical protein
MQKAVIVIKGGPRDPREKSLEFRLDESTNKMKIRVQLFYTCSH